MRHPGDPLRDGGPDDLRALAALVRLSARTSAIFRQAIGGRVQSNLQLATLVAIARRPGSVPTDLAHEAGVLVPSMSRVLRTLGAAGLVHASTDPADGRLHRLTLTAAGKQGLARAMAGLAEYARTPEVTGLPALLGVVDSGGDPASLDDQLTRVAEVGGAFAARMREETGDRPQAGLSTWVVITLCSRVVDPRPAALADWLCTSRPTMTGHLDRLEAQGLVVRLRPEQGDGRAVELALTPAGAAVCTRWRAALAAHSPEIGHALAGLVAAAARTAPATGG